jgi:imidazole glycerol phosphate synthase subunit HisF
MYLTALRTCEMKLRAMNSNCQSVFYACYRSGADKVSIGSDSVAVAEEYLKTHAKTGNTSIEQISAVYGRQAVVVSIDPKRVYVADPSTVCTQLFVDFECLLMPGRYLQCCHASMHTENMLLSKL